MPNPTLSETSGEDDLNKSEQSLVKAFGYLSTRERQRAFKSPVPLKYSQKLRERYLREKSIFSHLSFTEFKVFITEGSEELLYREKHTICVHRLTFRVVQRCSELVDFYTGLLDAAHFLYVNSIIQQKIFLQYSDWELGEKSGFLTHSFITFMKLRLNMTDKELALRFRVEPYIINMTLRLWLPALYDTIYKKCEELNRIPVPLDDGGFTKIVDIVQVRLEFPECGRGSKDGFATRKAVFAVRSDGLVCFASNTYSMHRPDDDCIQLCRFRKTIAIVDVVQAYPDHSLAVSSVGIESQLITEQGGKLIDDAAERVSVFRILQAIPSEYTNISHFIFPSCAGLSNFRTGDH